MKGSKRAKNGGWELRVYLGTDPVTGRPLHKSKMFRGSERDADSKLAQLVAETLANRGEDGQPTTAGTFDALLDRWIESRVDAGRKPSTIASYRDHADRYVRPVLGGRKLSSLKVRDFERLYGDMTRQGLAPNTVQKAHIICRAAINRAIAWGEFTRANPTLVAERAIPQHVELEVPEVPDVAAALLAWKSKNPGLMPLFWVSLITGARRSEVLGLRWHDLDLDEQRVRIRGSVTHYRGETWEDEESSKSKRVRWIDVDQATVQLLRDHEAWARDRARSAEVIVPADGYVFSLREDCRAPYHPPSVTQAWGRFRRTNGLDGVRLHDLRHAMVTALLDAGHDLGKVSERAGHTLKSTTQDIYQHTRKMKDRKAADIMGELVTPAKQPAIAVGDNVIEFRRRR